MRYFSESSHDVREARCEERVLRREVVKPSSMSMIGWFFRGPSLPLFGCRCGAEIFLGEEVKMAHRPRLPLYVSITNLKGC